jgi:hypothetical protein
MRDVERVRITTSINGGRAEELNFPYAYSAHRVANLCVRIIGFRDVFDRSIVLGRDVESNIVRESSAIRAIMPTINHQFKISGMKKSSSNAAANDNFIVITTKVLIDMYGIVIVRVGEVYKLEMTSIFAVYPDGIAPAREFI